MIETFERDYKKEQDELKSAIARFPKHFGLRAFPGKLFRVGVRESFVDDQGNPKLYTQVLTQTRELPERERRGHNPDGFCWLDFAKGYEYELAGQLAPIPEGMTEIIERFLQEPA